MIKFFTLIRRLIPKLSISLVLLSTLPDLSAVTNDLFVISVEMDTDQHVELQPGDPIRYTVTYGREAPNSGGTHNVQNVTYHVYLSTDGQPTNPNNFLLQPFGDSFAANQIGEIRTQTFTNRLPSNFTGTYYLLAYVVNPKVADLIDDYPATETTGASRVTIRPDDSATVSIISTRSVANPATGLFDTNEFSESPAVTADGRYVVFQSEATDIVATPAGIDGVSQIYLKDMVTGEVKMISQLGGQAGNAESKYPTISANGELDPVSGTPRYYIAYESAATNLVTGTGSTDTNQQTDIFLYDLASGINTLISVPTGSPAGQQAQGGGSFLPSISGNGRLIAFESKAPNLLGLNLDTNGKSDIFVYDRITKVVTCASATATGVLGNADSTQARISEDGSTVVYRSFAGNLASGVPVALPSSNIIAKTLVSGSSTGKTSRISAIREAFGATSLSYTAFNRDAFDPAVSKDGRFVAFASRATNTTAPNGDSNFSGNSQVYVVNRAVNAPLIGLTPADFDQVGNTSLNVVSVGLSPLDPSFGFANDESMAPTISGNGRYIGFRTEANNLLPINVIRSDGRVFQSLNSGVIGVSPENTGVLIDTPLVDITDDTQAGSGATAYAVLINGSVDRIVLQSPGQGYSTNADDITVVISGGGVADGSPGQATATATISSTGRVTGFTVTNGGFGYASAQAVFTDGVGSGATATAILDGTGGLRDITVATSGFGYNLSHTVLSFSPPDDPLGVEPTAVPIIENGRIYDIVVTSPGTGYITVPMVTITSVPLLTAEAEVALSRGVIDSISITDTGAGYVQEPIVYIDVTDSSGTTRYPDPLDPTLPQHQVSISAGLSGNAISGYADLNSTSDIYIRDTGIKSIVVTEGGSGYTDSFLISSSEIVGGGGSSAVAQVIVENGAVSRIDMIDTGSGYLAEPTVTLPASPGGGVQAVARAVLREGSDRITLNQFGEETEANGRDAATGVAIGYEVSSSRNLAMSSNGRYMLFASDAASSGGFIFGKSNRLPLDLNQKRDVFIVDRRIDEAVTPVRGTAPTVTLTLSTRDLPFNSTRVISAAAFDGGDVVIGASGEQTAKDGVIKKIEIYANNRLIATNSSPGTTSSLVLDTTWTAPQVAGPAQIYAVVTDGNGNRAFSAPSIIQVRAPISQRPSITLSSNLTTITVGSSVTIQATVSDPENQIGFVQFYSNGLLLSTDFAAPFEYVYTPTSSATYKLTAVVFDGSVVADATNGTLIGFGNDVLSNELTLRVLPPPSPTVNITSPSSGTTAASLNQPVFIELTATTTNPSASISTVILKDNGTILPGTGVRVGVSSTYRYTWFPTATGAHSLVALATDSQGGSAESASRQFTVSGVLGVLPTVDIVFPANGSAPILTQNTVVFQINATDSDGSVTSVVLYGNGSIVGIGSRNINSGLWEVSVDASLLQPGAYDFVAIVTDSSGNLVGSAPRSLLVATSAPTASIVAPVVPSGSTVVDTKLGQPFPVLIEARSQDLLSRISSVVVSVEGVIVGNAVRIGTTDQYAFVWTPDTTGVFKLIATASDTKSGSVQTQDLQVRVTEPIGSVPVVRITTPTSQTATDGTISPAIVANNSTLLLNSVAFDIDGAIVSVDYYLDGKQILRLTSAVPAGSNAYTGTYSLSGLTLGLHALTAIATDNSGNRTVSAAVALNVLPASQAAPTVNLAAPVPASLLQGQSTLLNATAGSAAFTSIAKVDFYANGVLIGTAATSPYVFVYTPATSGAFSIWAVVTDSSGATGVSASQSVTVNQVVGNAPTVVLTDTDQVTLGVGSRISFAAKVTAGNSSVTGVRFWANSTLIGVGTLASGTTIYQINYVNTLPVGSYSVYAEATDANGNVVQSASRSVTSIAVTAPSVRIVTPTGGSYNILDNNSFERAAARVELTITDGVFIGDKTVTGIVVTEPGLNYAPGVTAYMEVRNDPAFGGGIARTEPLTVTLGADGSVTALDLASNGDAAGRLFFYQNAVVVIEDDFNVQAISIVAAPSSGSTIEELRFYANGVLIDTRSGSPYSVEWRPSRSGTYVLHVELTDVDGITSSSIPVTVVINPAEEIAPAEVLAEIEAAYQKVFGRSPTSAETKAHVERLGSGLTAGQVAANLLLSADYRDDQGELLLIYLSVWGEFPNSTQYAALSKQRGFELNDATMVDSLLASDAYTQKYGNPGDVIRVDGVPEYKSVRAFALRTYRNMYGKDATGATANVIAQQFYYYIGTLAATPGEAVVTFLTNNLNGAKVEGALLTRLRLAGAILFIGGEKPTEALIKTLSGIPLATVTDYYFEGGETLAAGSVVTINVATGDEPAGTTFYASGLPKGLTINSATGVISGRIPGTIKAYAITYWTQRNGVRSASNTMLMLVEALPTQFVGSFEALLENSFGLPAGKVTTKVSSNASLSGTVYYGDGRNYSFSGVLKILSDGSSQAVRLPDAPIIIKRTGSLLPLVIDLKFTATGVLTINAKEQISVGVYSPVLSSGEAIELFAFSKSAPAPWRGVRTLVLSDVSPIPFPPFTATAGQGTFTVATNGVLSVRIRGADSAIITGSTGTTTGSDYRFYARPYSKTPAGYFSGWFKAASASDISSASYPTIENEVYWMRPAGGSGVFSGGFGPLSIQINPVSAP